MNPPDRFPPDDPRYPGVGQRVSENAYRDAMQIAEALIQWAEERLPR